MKNAVTYACFGVAATLGAAALWVGTSDPAPDVAVPQVVSTTSAKPKPVSSPTVTVTDTVTDTVTVTVNRDNVFTETTPVPVLRFDDCTQAYYSGAHHIPRGTPLYRPELDGDGDGVACTDPPFVSAPTVTETVTAPGTTVTVPTTVVETETVTVPTTVVAPLGDPS